MEALNLPTYSLSVKSQEGRFYIFDPVRKKYVLLTPEEWVRQHFLQYLVRDKGYPASLMAVEKEFVFNRMKKRSDILVHNRMGEPVLLVECKAPKVRVSREVFGQIGLYNLSHKVAWLVVTNGMEHYCCHFDKAEGKYRFVDRIPGWTEVQSPDP